MRDDNNRALISAIRKSHKGEALSEIESAAMRDLVAKAVTSVREKRLTKKIRYKGKNFVIRTTSFGRVKILDVSTNLVIASSDYGAV
ncbi:hypothetical protein [Aurantivibrio plasticivorans]